MKKRKMDCAKFPILTGHARELWAKPSEGRTVVGSEMQNIGRDDDDDNDRVGMSKYFKDSLIVIIRFLLRRLNGTCRNTGDKVINNNNWSLIR